MKLSRTKKYIDLKNARLFYDAKRDQVRLTSSDKRIIGGLNLLLKTGTKNEIAARDALFDIGNDDVYTLPTKTTIPEDTVLRPYSIPLGLGKEGNVSWVVDDDTSLSYSPHLNIMGSMGSGRSTMLHNIIRYCQQYPEHWNIIVGWNFFPEAPIPGHNVSVKHKYFEDMLTECNDFLNGILEWINTASRRDRAKRTLLVLPDFNNFLFYVHKGFGPRKELSEHIVAKVETLLRMGRQQQLHVVMESYPTDPIPDSFKNMIHTNIFLGRIHPQESLEFFGIDVTNMMPQIPWRGETSDIDKSIRQTGIICNHAGIQVATFYDAESYGG